MCRDRTIQELIRPEILALSAYHVAGGEDMIKLDAMENPYPLPDVLRGQWGPVLAGAAVNRYPAPQAPQLKDRLRAVVDVPDELEILLGNGSDELIQMLCLATARGGCTVMAPEPGFVMYSMLARISGMSYQGVALRADFSLDLQATLDAVKAVRPVLLFLAQPNNPTGNLFSEDHVRTLVENAPGLVVIDEAYTPFCDSDYMPLAREFEHVLILRTFSKVGLAGLRLGFLIGRSCWLKQIDKVRLPYNINALTQAGAVFALEHFEEFRAQARRIRGDRAHLMQSLQRIANLEVFPSEANFILARTLSDSARRVNAELEKRGILVKCLDGTHPLLANCLRITVGTPQENERCVAALHEIV